MNTQKLQCPFCDHPVEVPTDWIIKNERVFCGTCCKAFDVKLEKRNSKGYNYDEYVSGNTED